MASVLRRVQGCSTDPPSFNDLKHPGRQLTRHLAETVGIKEDDILKVMKGTQPIFTYVHEKNLTEPQMESRKEGKSVQKEESRKEGKSDQKEESRKEGKSDQKEESRKEGESDEKNIEKGKKGNCRDTMKEKQREMTEEASEPTKEQDGDNTIVSVDHEGMSAQPDYSIQDLCINQASFSLVTPLTPYAKSPTIAEECPGNCNSDIILAIPVADSSILFGVHDQKLRAMKLLDKGIMPLFPQAKREWDGVQTITILDGPVPLQWPPANWKTFSSEQKLHAWEMAAKYVASWMDWIFHRPKLHAVTLQFSFPSRIIHANSSKGADE